MFSSPRPAFIVEQIRHIQCIFNKSMTDGLSRQPSNVVDLHRLKFVVQNRVRRIAETRAYAGSRWAFARPEQLAAAMIANTLIGTPTLAEQARCSEIVSPGCICCCARLQALDDFKYRLIARYSERSLSAGVNVLESETRNG